MPRKSKQKRPIVREYLLTNRKEALVDFLIREGHIHEAKEITYSQYSAECRNLLQGFSKQSKS